MPRKFPPPVKDDKQTSPPSHTSELGPQPNPSTPSSVRVKVDWVLVSALLASIVSILQIGAICTNFYSSHPDFALWLPALSVALIILLLIVNCQQSLSAAHRKHTSPIVTLLRRPRALFNTLVALTLACIAVYEVRAIYSADQRDQAFIVLVTPFHQVSEPQQDPLAVTKTIKEFLAASLAGYPGLRVELLNQDVPEDATFQDLRLLAQKHHAKAVISGSYAKNDDAIRIFNHLYATDINVNYPLLKVPANRYATSFTLTPKIDLPVVITGSNKNFITQDELAHHLSMIVRTFGVLYLIKNGRLSEALALDQHLAETARPPNATYYEIAALINIVQSQQNNYSDDTLRQSVTDMNEAIKLHDTARDRVARGRTYFWLNKKHLAYSDANAAIQQEPKNELGYMLRADLERDDRKLIAALADADRAVEYASAINKPTSLTFRCQIRFMLGYSRGAEADLHEALALAPNDIVLLSELAQVLERRGQSESALTTLNNAIAKAPAEGVLYYLRGKAYLAQGKRSAAWEDFEKAIASEATSETRAIARACMGQIYFDVGDFANALRLSDEAVNENAQASWSSGLLGYRCVALNKRGGNEAINCVTKLLDADRGDPAAYNTAAAVLAAQGQAKQAALALSLAKRSADQLRRLADAKAPVTR